jgi:hypothetical protein
MKNVPLFFLTSLLLLVCGESFAQVRRNDRPTRISETSAYSNIIKINPLSLAGSTGSFAYERVINEQMSGQLGFLFTRYSGWVTGGRTLSGFAITPEFRYYLTGAAPQGFFVAPFLRYRRTSLEGDVTVQGRTFEGTLQMNTYGGGVLVGGQFVVGERVSFEGFIGPTINGRSFEATEETTERDYDVPNFFSPVWFRTGITVGFLF